MEIEGLDPQTVEAIIGEVMTGRKFMEENCKLREAHAAREAFASRGHKTSKVLGKKINTMPGYEWFLIRNKLGEEAMHDPQTFRDIRRHAPEFGVFRV